MKEEPFSNCLSSNDVLNYLSHLKEIKKSIPNYTVSEDENIFTIYDSNNIPKISLSKDIYKVFKEIEV
jgi:hypothetical protein